jgi:hypothetical protein
VDVVKTKIENETNEIIDVKLEKKKEVRLNRTIELSEVHR